LSIILNTFAKQDIRQYECKRCKDVLMESGCFRMEGVKEIRMVGTWRKENYHVRTLTHPMDPSKIICIDVYCKCDRCGHDNQFIVATTFDDKKKIRVQYNRLSEGKGKLYG
jgi:hypothetical protein